MIVVDSSVWIALIKGHASEAVEKLETIENPSEIIVGDLVLLEVLQGAKSPGNARFLEHALRRFKVETLCEPSIAVEAAAIYRDLRARGITIRRTVDMVIATYCIRNSYQLLQQDRDFQPFATHCGLRLM
ncbi:type II toxin-antitoxin system VapC family toxin [Pannonibacter carbonis]|uniref:type II toxin-antitoxin system VapC family toxin n=1 Tax=Pannonibacter carbonis TaxID=2067569 RepID=UPI000D0E45F2|nr:PIN domain-containing protein [Pannonibacter carbonis]